MSVLIVKNVTHGFGARGILDDVSFRLLKGEHVALIGANGEGKSTFMNIITGNLMPKIYLRIPIRYAGGFFKFPTLIRPIRIRNFCFPKRSRINI